MKFMQFFEKYTKLIWLWLKKFLKIYKIFVVPTVRGVQLASTHDVPETGVDGEQEGP